MNALYEHGEQALRDLEEYLEFRAFRDIDPEFLTKLAEKVTRWKLIHEMNEEKMG